MSTNRADDWRKLDNLGSVAVREAWLWSQAVHQLCNRIDVSDDDLRSQTDAMLLAVSYRNIHRGVAMAAHHATPDNAERLRAVMAAADDVAPDARKVRDMLEHFDDYEAGRGRLQPKAADERIREQLAMAHQICFRRGESYALIVGGCELEVAAVRRATRILMDGLHEHG